MHKIRLHDGGVERLFFTHSSYRSVLVKMVFIFLFSLSLLVKNIQAAEITTTDSTAVRDVCYYIVEFMRICRCLSGLMVHSRDCGDSVYSVTLVSYVELINSVCYKLDFKLLYNCCCVVNLTK